MIGWRVDHVLSLDAFTDTVKYSSQDILPQCRGRAVLYPSCHMIDVDCPYQEILTMNLGSELWVGRPKKSERCG